MNLECKHCGKDAVACDCIGMGDRLKAVADNGQVTAATKALVLRQERGKDIPASCCKPGCNGDPMFIPVISVPTRRKTDRKLIFLNAELLNGALCQKHKDTAKLDEFFDAEAVDRWARYCQVQNFRAPLFGQAKVTFRPLTVINL